MNQLLADSVDEPDQDWFDKADAVRDALVAMGSDFVFAMNKGKPAAKIKKGPGAKAVKAFEREVGASDKLGSNDATTFRAISARSNYLAQDRPGTHLCREFGQPGIWPGIWTA